MPKVQLSNSKGLVQLSGKGFEHSDTAGEVGFHRWVEELSISAVADNDVAARVGMYIPAQARITNAHIIGTELATSADASVALEVHTADVAVDAASAGTEIVGADEAGNKSLPDSDLNLGSGDTLNDNINMGTLAAIDRGTDVSYFQLAAKENMAAMTGTPKVVVIIEWFGPAAVSLV
tara:strand:+ start:227 stop:760 length:534 start_codon:yes stop_codon:yes gene_type:complete